MSVPQNVGPRPRGRPRSMPIEEQRRVVLDAARKEFAARDFNGTTIEAVAKAAGVARPLVYELFGSKEDLFVAVVDDTVSTVVAFMGTRFDGSRRQSFPDSVRFNVEAVFDFVALAPDMAAIVRLAEHGGMGAASREVIEGRLRIEQALADLFRASWTGEHELSREGSRLAATITLSLVETAAWRQPHEDWDRDAVIDVVSAFIQGGLDALRHGATGFDRVAKQTPRS